MIDLFLLFQWWKMFNRAGIIETFQKPDFLLQIFSSEIVECLILTFYAKFLIFNKTFFCPKDKLNNPG